MFGKPRNNRTYLEIMLVFIALATTVLFCRIHGYKMVVLYLFYLPVILSAFFLGRYLAGLLAVFCTLLVSVMTAFDWTDFAAYNSPIIISLAVCIWAATLGLTALLAGTLSDDRASKMKELKEAYVGIVEVLSRYLQSANPHLKARSVRVAELSQMVAARMRLSPKQIDDIRIAALLYDIGKIEITTRLINKAVNTIQANPEGLGQDTFQGTEFIHSLSDALSLDILPLIEPDTAINECYASDDAHMVANIPTGARIIRTVRAYDDLTQGALGEPPMAAEDAIRELRSDTSAEYDREIVNSLEYSVSQTSDKLVQEPQYAF